MFGTTACIVDTAAPGEKTLAHYLGLACEHSPVIAQTLERFGDGPISGYAGAVFEPSEISFQDRSDFIEAIREISAPLISEEAADRLAQDTDRLPAALTANHHGVDFFAQSVQGSILYALMQQQMDPARQWALVLSCGNIPLDNLTYPQGLLLYGLAHGNIEDIPKKLPVFSNKKRRKVVSVSPGYDRDMVNRSVARVRKMADEGILGESVAAAAATVLSSDYASEEALNIKDYSGQAVLVNRRIWSRLFADPASAPELVCLELEKVAAALTVKDLFNSESLLWNILFVPDLRDAVLDALNGHSACWTLEDDTACTPDPLMPPAFGTHFFWGVGDNGRKFPLRLAESGRRPVLVGRDDHGRELSVPLRPSAIKSHLEERKILPSLFVCFLTLSLARGINCIGGYYQAEYLPNMKKRLLFALNRVNWVDAAQIIEKAPTGAYLSGMQPVMIQEENRRLVPAGPIEIIARGGLTNSDIDRIRAMTVEVAHTASLAETIPDVMPKSLLGEDNWKESIARLCFERLADRVVVK